MIKIALILTLAGLGNLANPASPAKFVSEFPEIIQETVETESEIPAVEKTVEEVVREYFKDIPILAEVARCESTFRHFDEQGRVLRGLKNPQDVGVMQINERFHLDKSLTLETDIYDLIGNLEYARYLYDRKGLEPWRASQKCWKGKT